MTKRDDFTPVAEQVPYDNTDSDLVSGEVKAALDELDNKVSTSASPGFSFGRASNVNNGTWLLCETVPSNKAGRYVYINNAVVEKIFVGSETVSTYDLEIYYHDGDSINLTLLDTVSIVSARGGAFTVGQAVATNKHIAIKLVNGSARNIVAGLELSGTD